LGLSVPKGLDHSVVRPQGHIHIVAQGLA
jgi:hypothetical protein